MLIPNVAISTNPPKKGDLCDLYEGVMGTTEVVVKVASDEANNDLVEAEGRMLRRLFAHLPPNNMYLKYLCQCLSSGRVEGKAYNVITRALEPLVTTSPEYISLEEVMKAYPKGIDFRDAVWMFKRALVVLGWVNTHQNVIHGNVTPAHILVHPIGHGGKLIDWSYAVPLPAPEPSPAPAPASEPASSPSNAWARILDEDEDAVVPESERPHPGYIQAITPKYDLWYPPEVFLKKAPTPATDLFMLAKTFVVLMGGSASSNYVPSEVPRKIRDLLHACLVEDIAKRPNHAWQVHERIDVILHEVVGKSTYRPFVMP